jgi:clan AA aspartic protease
MISGQVTADLEAVVPIRVRSPSGSGAQIDALLDTGFSGELSLSPHFIAALKLPFRQLTEYTLADGRSLWFRVYRAVIDWGGQVREVLVVEADGGALIGMLLLHGHDLSVRVLDGGPVTIVTVP